MKDIQYHIDELNKLLHNHFIKRDFDAAQQLEMVNGCLEIEWKPVEKQRIEIPIALPQLWLEHPTVYGVPINRRCCPESPIGKIPKNV